MARLKLALLALPAAARAHVFPGCDGGTTVGCPGVPNTTMHWIQQSVDHFNWAPPLGNASHMTYMQRYFVNDKWFDKDSGPVFFYFGNEDNVELYVNHTVHSADALTEGRCTGLMWESAPEFGALLVFAEHRYYGESMPYTHGQPGCMSWLTSEQAMADFASLIYKIKDDLGRPDAPVVGFGGSYGGMIAAWFRLKDLCTPGAIATPIQYPNAVDGVIAASAPIWSFVGRDPPYDFNAFDETVTADAS
eukprot:gene1174-2677_t